MQLKVKGRSTIDVILELNDKSMDVVTISTGYQRIERKYLTGSVTSLKMDSLMQPGLTTVDKMLEGRVPGMIYMQNSGQPGAAPKLRIRGTSTFLGSQEPLWVVDGIVQTDPINIPASRINDLDFVNLVGNAVSGINLNDIEQVDVLKDAAATALYGVRASQWRDRDHHQKRKARTAHHQLLRQPLLYQEAPLYRQGCLHDELQRTCGSLPGSDG